MEEVGGGGENSQDELSQMQMFKLLSLEDQEILRKTFERAKNNDKFREALVGGMKLYSSNPDQEIQTSVENDDETHEQVQRTDVNNIDPPRETHSSSSTEEAAAAASISAVNETSAEMETKAQSNLLVEEYNMYKNENRIRQAIIFSQKEKSGIREIDREKLKCVFEQLEFTVVVHEDKTKDETRDILEALSREDHSNEDCLIITVLTHGTNNSLMASDEKYEADMLWTTFSGERCPTLVGKPKIFFIQAFPGEQDDQGMMVDSAAFAGNTYKIPSYADFLIMNSTVEGFCSWKNPGEGSWFISTLCKVLSCNDGSEELSTLLLKVSAEMESEYVRCNPENPYFHNCKQVPCLRSTLTRKVFFKPKVLRQHLQPDENTEDSFQPYRHARKIPSPLLKYGNENKPHCLQGHAVIFNHVTFKDPKVSTRKGSAMDVYRLERLLSSLGFTMDIYRDTKKDEMKLILSNLAKEDLSKIDSLLITILTHGSSNGMLQAFDVQFREEELWKPFTGVICPSLAGKPKIFLIQACRGEEADPGVPWNPETEIDFCSTPAGTPSEADFLLCYATFEGHVSFRGAYEGSWFIRTLCDELDQQSHDIRFLEVLKKVSQRVAHEFESDMPNSEYNEKKQIPSIYSTLSKDIILEKTGNGYVRRKNLSPDPLILEKRISSPVSQNNEDPIPIEDPILTAEPIWSQPIHKFAYTMNFDKRGQAIIFNHENFLYEDRRVGTAEDVKKLEDTFMELQFETKVYKDKCRIDVIKIMENVAKADHSDSDCLVVCVLTLAYNYKSLWARDDEYPIESLWSPFVEYDNPSLNGKPKIFIIQPCQGQEFVSIPYLGWEQMDLGRMWIERLSPDSLIVYNCCLGCVSYGNPGTDEEPIKGTFFINALTSDLLKGYETLDLFNIMTQIYSPLAEHYKWDPTGDPKNSVKKQLPLILSTLTGHVYFRRKTFDC